MDFSLFENQLYPTPEETAVNNVSVLYKRKKFFLTSLRHDVKIIGFLLLTIVYLRDISMLRFIIRGFLQYTLSNPFPATHLYTEESKKSLIKMLLLSVFFINGFCVIIHLIFGSFSSNPIGGHYLYGGMTVEFIGERTPINRLELVIYDLVIMFCQLVLHTIQCFVDDSEILLVKRSDTDSLTDPTDDSNVLMKKLSDDNDGYNGKVMLISIHLLDSIKTVMSYETSLQFDAYNPDLTTESLPGTFNA